MSSNSKGRRSRGPYRKYRNQKTVLLPDGTTHPLTPERVGQGLLFDSKKECLRWLELCELQRQGRISFLRRQVRFRLVVQGPVGSVRVCTYVADYVYMEAGLRVIEDCKSPMTKKLREYILKRTLMWACLGIQIRETV
jgi:hypothetical protein